VTRGEAEMGLQDLEALVKAIEAQETAINVSLPDPDGPPL
jgi:hypothetical protein